MASNPDKAMCFSDEMVLLMYSVLSRMGEEALLIAVFGKQYRKRLDKNRATLFSFLKTVPLFMRRCLRERAAMYSDESFLEAFDVSRDDDATRPESVLGTRSYCLVINAMEKDTKGQFRIANLKSASDWRQCFLPYDAALTKTDIQIAALQLLLSCRVSYKDIKEGRHPRGVTHDPIKLEDHYCRDAKLAQMILELSMQRDGGSPEALDKLCEKIYLGLLIFEDLQRLYEEMSEEQVRSFLAREPRPCKVCFIDIKGSSLGGIRRPISAIFAKCPSGVHHVSHSLECSYVCKCGAPGGDGGHFVASCPVFGSGSGGKKA